jgi:hypothetical protein
MHSGTQIRRAEHANAYGEQALERMGAVSRRAKVHNRCRGVALLDRRGKEEMDYTSHKCCWARSPQKMKEDVSVAPGRKEHGVECAARDLPICMSRAGGGRGAG